MMSLSRILAVFAKEFLQLSRDRLSFGMVVGIPLVQLLLFGYAINTDVRNISAAIADAANTNLSREMVADISASQVIDLHTSVATAEELKLLLDAGEVSIGIVIPVDFDRRILRRDRPAAQILVDGSDPIIVGVARGLSGVSAGFDTQGAEPSRAPIFELRNFYNPESRSAVNIVPGLVGVILTMTMVLFTAVAIVREKERGNMELLINTPIKTIELMLGKIIPYILIGLVQLTIILSLGWIFFHVPIRGTLLQVLIAALVFIATNLSLGLFISTSAQTQFQAMQMTFFFFLPSILLSGFMFPFDGMPALAQYLAEILPLTHFNRLIRGIVLRGTDIMTMWQEVLALLAFMLVAMTLAVLRFSKRLD